MFKYNIEEFASIVDGKLIGSNSNEYITDLLIDSRKIVHTVHCCFFAFKSEKNNGHKYIPEIYNSGIRIYCVDMLPEKIQKDAYYILVNNTIDALQKFAKKHREQFSFPIIGITGSNGKTIVKEWLHQLLNNEYNIVRSPKSYNSQIGVPLSVLQIDKENDLGIFEAGISEPQMMSNLKQIILPDIGIFTNIGPAHADNFVNDRQKINEKLQLFIHSKCIIFCTDYPEIKELIYSNISFRDKELFSFGKINANVIVEKIEKNKKSTDLTIVYQENKIDFSIPFSDSASIENALCCATTLLYLKKGESFIQEQMLKLCSIAMRLELKEGINNCSIINDSYNSDINSLNIALDFLAQQNQNQKKTIILSDILQSGKSQPDLYSEVAKELEARKINKIIGIGPNITNFQHLFTQEKTFFNSTNDFLTYFSVASFNNESILLKGARSFKFERINQALQQKGHETVMEINLNAITKNYDYFRKLVHPKTKIMAMVKAFSYGTGSYEIANLLQYNQVDYLTVAYADEGVELRKAGITSRIMVMNPDEQSLDAIINFNLEPEIYNFRIFDLLEESIRRNIIQERKPILIHLKLDTGMHRLGFEEKDLNACIAKIKSNPHVLIRSIFSHLVGSDAPMHDDYTHQQVERFEKMYDKIAKSFNYPILKHILNSAGIIRHSKYHFDMVRLGIALYGIPSCKEHINNIENVSTLKSIISQIKEIPKGESVGYNRSWYSKRKTRIATIPIGYADGINRKLGNENAFFIVNGKQAPILGDICMDMCMMDITDIEAKEGDTVIIFGDENPVADLAKKIDTIPYEILTSISRRVKRIYFHE